MLVDFGKAGLIGKARQQPDKVKMVLQKLGTDGVVPTIESVLNKLDQPLPLGYCNVGVVEKLGGDTPGFDVGNRVVSNGKHAEVVSVPKNLAARIPDNVGDEEAAFTVLAAIGLQGVRLANPTIGETVVVSGLGLIGLLTVQILRANGCRVLGLDFNEHRLHLAQTFGADVVDLRSQDPVAAAASFSRGHGVDAVLVTAATKSNEPMHQAAQMCRKRGRIILVGVAGLELSRSDYYEKELTFQVSCSYGPGRYDPSYEEKGNDYPFGLVRWTEQRNFEAVLDLMSCGALNVKPLITHRFKIDAAAEAYELVANPGDSLGIILDYPDSQSQIDIREVRYAPAASRTVAERPRVAFIGSGNYASAVLIPAFRQCADLGHIVSESGATGSHAAKKFGFRVASTDAAAAIESPDTDAVVICTRHDSHADLVVAALEAGKHVFVEKPLALRESDIDRIESLLTPGATGDGLVLTVGFNRRFAPHAVTAKSLLKHRQGPHAFVMTVNAGQIPETHWTQDPDIGGGRIVGEACHFIDLLRHLAGYSVEHFTINRAATKTGDVVTVSMTFADGSIGAVHYLANGNKAFPKERLEVFSGGSVLQLDNFRRLRGYGWAGFTSTRGGRQDKGQTHCVAAFAEAISGDGRPPIDYAELMEVSRISIRLAECE